MNAVLAYFTNALVKMNLSRTSACSFARLSDQMTFTIYKAKDSSQQRRRVAFGPGKASKVGKPSSRRLSHYKERFFASLWLVPISSTSSVHPHLCALCSYSCSCACVSLLVLVDCNILPESLFRAGPFTQTFSTSSCYTPI